MAVTMIHLANMEAQGLALAAAIHRRDDEEVRRVLRLIFVEIAEFEVLEPGRALELQLVLDGRAKASVVDE